MPTAIQWTDETWNPVTGCTKVSPGCARCYIVRTPAFRMSGRKFVNGHVPLQLHPDRLERPLHWERPRMVFVNSLSDLFHEDIPFDYIDRVFDTMRQAEQHTFQVLTKRPARAQEWFAQWFSSLANCVLPNVWLGVSIENARYTWRADVLREIPAAVRFISAEPLLGSLFPGDCPPERPRAAGNDGEGAASVSGGRAPLSLDGIDWLIVGGESGPGSRIMELIWARQLVAACEDAGVACFVKQLGTRWARVNGAHDRKGGDWDEWPSGLRVREWPS